MLASNQFKTKVIDAFSARAASYDQYALVQASAVHKLASIIAEFRQSLIEGPILELGCGTGTLSVALIELFPDRDIFISDLSSQMLKQCQQRIEEHFGQIPKRVHLQIIDAEKFKPAERFATIASSFTLQWLSDIPSALKLSLENLRQYGRLFFAVPSNHSFPEWKSLCESSNVACTANPLPALESLPQYGTTDAYQNDYQVQTICQIYPSLLNFLRDIKASGASTSTRSASLSHKQLMKLLDYADTCYPANFSVTYEIIFGHITRRL